MDTINSLSLRFSPAMERRFLDDYFARSLFPARIGLLIGLLIYVFFGIWDGLVGEEAKATLWLIRFGIGAPWLVIVFVLSFSRHFKRWMQPLMCTVMLVTGMSLLAMLTVSPVKLRADSYYPGLMLIVFYSCTFLKIRFWYAACSVLLLLFAYQAVVRDFVDLSFTVLGHNLFFLGGAGSIGLVVCYAMERYIRGDFQLENRHAILLKELREQKEVAERAHVVKTQFLAAASHDMRQPLHAIALFGAVLQKELDGHPAGANATRLMRAVNALGKSLDSMLDISRLDAGVITPVVGPVPVNALFQALNHVFEAKASELGLQLRLRASTLWVRSDPHLLQRLLFNLVDNALKYTTQGGVLVVARARDTQVWIDVRDTGIGMPAEQLDRIFEEFYQIDNPGRDRALGLGIGLSVVQRLSGMLGHTVQVRSRPGRGTLLRVILPLADASGSSDASDAATAWQPDSSGRFRLKGQRLPQRVLIIDDEIDIRDAIVALLRVYGVHATAVADEAEAALALTQAATNGQPYEALLCDFRLARGADGLDAGMRLQNQFGPNLALLLITGETAPDKLQRIHDLNIPVIFKPASATTLLQALAERVSRFQAN